MILPRNVKKRDEKLEEIKQICLQSKPDRDSLYLRRKRYMLFGTSDYSVDVKYNRLSAHLDLVSSFLYDASHARYSIMGPRNDDEDSVAQVLALEDEWNEVFRDCGLAYQFSDAVLWSLVYDSMFIKLGWNDARDDLTARLFSPEDFGVYDEAEPDLDTQEAFIHSYSLQWDNAVLRLLKAGMKSQIPNLTARAGSYAGDMPPVLANMIISSTGGPNLAGAMTGRANIDYEPRPSYEPTSDNPTVRFHELYCWDDISEDYAIFTMADGVNGVLSDSRETIEAMGKATDELARHRYQGDSNIFLPGEHPFVHVRPYALYNYFWGESHAERLLNLQVWSNDRLQQISDILEQQVDPAKVFSGFGGLADDKASALGGPGSWVLSEIPGSKVESLAPKMPEDLFLEYNNIGHIFLDASGLTETTTGHGTEGVRGAAHAKKLATTGSGRIKKIAIALEQPLVKAGDVGLKLLARNSPNRLKTDTGQLLVPSLAKDLDKLRIRIAGHSHSPLFADESKEEAAGLFKSGAIDREDLIEMLDPPNRDRLIHKLRKRAKAEQQQKQIEMMTGNKPSKPKAA